jgi:hypothetical protein
MIIKFILQYQFIAFIFIISFTSCSPIPYFGNWSLRYTTHEEIDNFFIKGQTTKEQVKEKFGSPNSTRKTSSEYTEWEYYYSGGPLPFLDGPLIFDSIYNKLNIYFQNDIVVNYRFSSSTL